MFLAIIPINDFSVSKSRLRRLLKSNYKSLVTDLSRELAFNVLTILNKIPNLEIIAVTPTVELSELNNFNSITNFRSNIHDHSVIKGCAGFNAILESIVAKNWHLYEGIFIIMSDLPLLEENSTEILENIRRTTKNKIIPSKDGGTSLLYLSKPSSLSKKPIKFFYGKNSAKEFTKYFNGVEETLEMVVDENIAFDLDTLEDANIIAETNCKFSSICKEIINKTELEK